MILASRHRQALRGETAVPGDKSISHRAAMLAAMANGESRVSNFLRAGVTQVMLDSLSRAGVGWQWQNATLVMQGRGAEGFAATAESLFCGNSATTFRLMAGAIVGRRTGATGEAQFVLDGSQQLRRRPMARLIEPLRAMGAVIQSMEAADCAPLIIRPAALHGVEYRMAVASAQVKSAILLAGLSADGATTVHEPSPSRDHTERFLRWLGVRVDSEPCCATVYPMEKPFPAFQYAVPGDFSSAAFLVAAATVLTGSEILIQSVGINPRRVGLLSALRRMGADVTVLQEREFAGEPVGDLRIRSAELTATNVEGDEVVDMIDEFPIFAVAAACANGITIVRQAQELRHKESDRISVLAAELRKLGVQVDEIADGFAIHGPTRWRSSAVDAHGDHRLAMALAVAGLVCPDGVSIVGSESIAESFPEFAPILGSLGAEMA
jgi:3-phosphoshikimate 1-carboxyvinyltransferase